ncbi:MAG: glycosyltransferase [Steroidobacteraceae bacterium]
MRPTSVERPSLPASAEREQPVSSEPSPGDSRQPSVLILLASYNGAKWIRQQIESILAQEQVNIQVIVKDDGSSDSTPATIDSLQAGARVKLSHHSRHTGSAAQNFLALIRENPADDFEFVALADQDDTWHPNKLYKAVSSLAHNGCAGYSSATLAVWPDGRSALQRQSDSITRGDYLFEGAGQGCTFVLSAAFYRQVRRFITDKSNLTQSLHYHDWAIYALARAWEQCWSFDAEPSMTYRQHDSNDTGARNSMRGAGKRLRLIRQGWYRSQLAIISELCAAAAPSNSTVAAWQAILRLPDGGWRRLRAARFCLRAGRRRLSDRVLLVTSCLLGWI